MIEVQVKQQVAEKMEKFKDEYKKEMDGKLAQMVAQETKK